LADIVLAADTPGDVIAAKSIKRRNGISEKMDYPAQFIVYFQDKYKTTLEYTGTKSSCSSFGRIFSQTLADRHFNKG
jgi:hypothetical protein